LQIQTNFDTTINRQQPPQDGEPLYLYVVVTTQVVSVVIVVERTEEGHTLPVQRLVYYISEVLSETKM
jgi:hypothetical protein